MSGSMELLSDLTETLCIPKHHQRLLSAQRVACLVPEEWLYSIYQKNIREFSRSSSLSPSETALLLAPSHQQIPKPWTRICVKVVSKSDQLVERLPDVSLYNVSPAESGTEHLVQTAKVNFRNLWTSAHVRLNPETIETSCRPQQQFSSVVRQYLQRLRPGVYISLLEDTDDAREALHHLPCDYLMQNVSPILAVIETLDSFYILQPYIACTLRDITAYSPAVFSSSHAKALFVLYQILQAMTSLHSQGLSAGHLSLHNILIDDKLWINVPQPQISILGAGRTLEQRVSSGDCSESLSSSLDMKSKQELSDLGDMGMWGNSECENLVDEGVHFVRTLQHMSYKLEDLSQLTEDWTTHKISNFKYLMILNHLAGRRMCDPNHHPVVPWVMDFTSPDSGYRNLKMSKFRLNKGDGQLDFTYDGMAALSGNTDHIPHHVTDVLSDITYYVYKARRTPKHILCSYVRTKWVPNEYPISAERLYRWTPDECIPEFFTDPTIFTSIHEDLPDLELPGWCSSAQEFINRHMEVLESEKVTSRLHSWIDLTFGYKMSGVSAVKAKNVCLPLVDKHKTLLNHGIVQLFHQPHPNRLSADRVFSALSPRVSRQQFAGTGSDKLESSPVILPNGFNPLATLDHFEALHSFSSKTMHILPPSTRCSEEHRATFSDLHDNMRIVWQDMQQFGCLMCELFLAPKLHGQVAGTSLKERYRLIRLMYAEDSDCIPRLMRTAAATLLHVDDKDITPVSKSGLLFEYPIVNALGLPPPTPALLIQPYTDILPFPEYFQSLYELLSQLKGIDTEIESLKSDMTKPKLEKKKLVKILARQKVDLMDKYLLEHQGQITQEGYELILPYVEELFKDSDTVVQAAWSLVSLVSRELGRSETTARLLQYLTKLFSGEDSTPKHMKLYHRSFIVQLLLWLGLQPCLTNFATLLVEAVAGYKDFVTAPEGDTSQEDIEEDSESTDFLREDSKLDETLRSIESEQEESEDLSDVRPDLYGGEEDVSGSLGDRDGEEEDLEEFPNFVMDEDCMLANGKDDVSTDSFSMDQISERSVDSESTREEDGRAELGSGSVDRASIHSITHIMGLTQAKKPSSASLVSQGDDSNMDGIEDDQSEGRSSSSSQSKETILDSSQSNKGNGYGSNSRPSYNRSTSFMIRSETDEFSQIHHTQTINIRDVAGETVKWLSHRLGPLLTAKYLSKNLVRMLALCYLGEDQLYPIPDTDERLPKSTRLVQGDDNANKVLECLSYVSSLYGEQVILLQYIPCIIDMIQVARKRLTIRAEAGLVAAMVLMRHIVPLLSDRTFINILEESLINDSLQPLMKLVSSVTQTFPSGKSVRSLILYKLVDVLYVIGLRLGFELTRLHMTESLQNFFKPFEHLYAKHMMTSAVSSDGLDGREGDTKGHMSGSASASSTDESYLNIKMDMTTQQYTIGSPITLSSSGPPTNGSGPLQPAPRPLKAMSRKSNYSLSTGQMIDDRDEVSEGQSAETEDIELELRQTFNPELALAAYIPLTSVFGSHHMDENLSSDDLIRKLCSQYDSSLYSSGDEPVEDDELYDEDLGEASQEPDGPEPAIGSNVEIVGNRICLQESEPLTTSMETRRLRQHFSHKGILRIDPDETRCKEQDFKKHRHLRGNWLAYWEHELGLNERDTLFNFKQIKLQTFVGHTNSIRSLTCLDSENSFISASKDKTVKLWSLTSFGEGDGKCRPQHSYEQHKKSVFSVAYLENVRLVASCDSTVHIWDPFTGDTIRQLDSTKHSPVIALTSLPLPSTVVVTATTENTLRFLDVRSASYAHEFKCVVGSAGLIRAVTVNPEGTWIAVGFSSGIISVLDLHTGIILGTWKGHESEIIQLKAYNKASFISTGFDLSMKLWSVDDLKETCLFKGHTEPVHCVSFYRDQIVSATTGNRIGVHTSVDRQANFSSVKLRSETFKGVLTSMAILPMNRTLLLGADNGSIRLLC